MNRLRRCGTRRWARRRSWRSPGWSWSAYLITHVLANLLVFQGPDQINAYSRFLHGTGGASVAGAARAARAAGPPYRGGACSSRRGARPRGPVAYAGGRQAAGVHLGLAHDPLGRRASSWCSSSTTSCTSRSARCTPRSSRATPTTTSRPASHDRLVVVFYELAMAAVGLHLYHGDLEQRAEPGLERGRRRIRSGGSWRWCCR